MRVRRTVLVIGSGGAGLTAAVFAARNGADVYVASKVPCGRNSSTMFSGGVFTLASGSVAPDVHFERTMKAGCHVNDPSLVRVLVDEAEVSLKELCSLGMGIRFPRDGMASVRHTSVHKLMGGEGFLSQMSRYARSIGVKFIDYSSATRLLFDDRKVVGAEIVNWRTRKGCLFSADSIVIATGGGGQIFKRTDNPARVTGDGYALAADAGLPLIGMEFTQFYPLGWDDPALPVWMADLSLIDSLPLTDASGNEFLLAQLKEWGLKNGVEGNLYARDRSAAAIARVARDGGAWLHFECADDSLWDDKAFFRALIINKERFRKLRRPVRVEPLEHYFCGGIKIDAECRTGIDGLYACGEVTGGVDGANRIGGNALANIVTFGRRAGRNAATGEARHVSERTRGTEAPRFSGHVNPDDVRKELQDVVWRGLGPLRTEAGIKEVLQFIDEHEGIEPGTTSPHDYLEALELHGLFVTARAVARGALARKESLGVHFRTD